VARRKRNDEPVEQAQGPIETDDRFPTGPWTGFFLQPVLAGKHWMELSLSFRQGTIQGEGRDWVGPFLIRGRYQVEDGKCWWTKSYIGKHSIAYQGYNEGKGIWGTWEYQAGWRGGFHIWPEAMGDPSSPHLSEAIETPAETTPTPEVEVETGVTVAEPEPVGAPADSELRGCSR